MKDFEAVWLVIVTKLQPGDEIKNWGSARGYTGGTFKIEQVHNSCNGVFGGDMTEPRDIVKGDALLRSMPSVSSISPAIARGQR